MATYTPIGTVVMQPAAMTSQSSSGMTAITTGGGDDTVFTMPNFGFNFQFYNNVWTNAYVGSNSYVTNPTLSAYNNFTPTRGKGIFIDSADNKSQWIGYIQDPNGKYYTLHFEGNTYSGSDTLCWDVTFFVDGTIQFVTDNNTRFPSSHGSSFLTNGVNDSTAITFSPVPSQSYVFVPAIDFSSYTMTTGASYQLNSGGGTSTDASITSVLANATTSSLAPTVTAQQQVAVSGVVASANANELVPTLSTQSQVSISSVVANANANSLTPSFSSSGSVSIASPVSASTASVLSPSIGTGNTIASGMASATASGLAPQVGSFTNVSINVVVSNATAKANIPNVSAISNISVNAPVSNATAMAFVPNVGSGSSVTIPAVLASMMAGMANPSVSTTKNVLMYPSTAGTTANANSPIISRDSILSAIVAGMQAAGLAPTLIMNANTIVSKVYLKGSRELSVTLQGSRQLNVTLRGSV